MMKKLKKIRTKKAATRKAKQKKNTNMLGTVTHYFDKINVAVVKLSQPLKIGAYVEFRHDNDSFAQFVESMQINHKAITGAKAKSEIGLKVVKPVKVGWVMLKAHQPTLMESVAKKEASMPNPPIPSGPQNKTGYGEVKFFKF